MLNIKEVLNSRGEPERNLLAWRHLADTSDQFVLSKASSLRYSRDTRESFKEHKLIVLKLVMRSFLRPLSREITVAKMTGLVERNLARCNHITQRGHDSIGWQENLVSKVMYGHVDDIAGSLSAVGILTLDDALSDVEGLNKTFKVRVLWEVRVVVFLYASDELNSGI